MPIKILFNFLIICRMLNAAEPQPLVLLEYGFEIEPLEEKITTSPGIVLYMLLAPRKDFSPNVNVTIQRYDATAQDYFDLSKRGFEQAKFKILHSAVLEEGTMEFEYQGETMGQEMHWYARAILKDRKAYIVTATAKEKDWQELSPKLKKCVNSFKVK